MTAIKQVKNSFLYSFEAAVSALMPLVALPVFTRIFTKEEYGILALAYVYSLSAAGIANFAMSISFDRNFFQYNDQRSLSALLYSTLAFQIAFALLLGAATFIFKTPLARWIIGNSEYAGMIFWSYCSCVVINLNYFYLSYFKNTDNAIDNIKYRISESIFTFLLSLGIVILFKSGIIGLVWGRLITSSAVFCILSVRFLSFMKPSLDFRILNDSLKICYPLSPRLFFKIIGNQFDKYMVRLLDTTGGVGIYSIGQKIAGVGFTFMTALDNVFIPGVYKRMFGSDTRARETIGGYLTPFLYVSIAIALMISLFTEELIYVMTPKAYHGVSDIAAILSMSYGIMFFSKQPQLLFAKKMSLISFLAIFGILLNIGINIPFIKMWGALGAAWATLTAGLLSAVISFIIYQHYYPIRWEYLKVLIIFLLFFGSALLTLTLKFSGIPYEPRIIVKLLCVSVYACAGFRFGILTKQGISSILREIR